MNTDKIDTTRQRAIRLADAMTSASQRLAMLRPVAVVQGSTTALSHCEKGLTVAREVLAGALREYDLFRQSIALSEDADVILGAQAELRIKCADAESDLQRAEELAGLLSSRKPEATVPFTVRLASTGGVVGLLGALVAVVVSASSACSNIKKADADSKVAAAAATGKLLGPLTLSYVDRDAGENLGDYVLTASLNVTALGAQDIFVLGIDFEAYVGLLEKHADTAQVDYQIDAIIPPNASEDDQRKNRFVSWRKVESRSFPDPSGCWTVATPQSHARVGFTGSCNVNGAGHYDVGESFISSRAWRLELTNASLFAVVARIHWSREEKGPEATPWEFVQIRALKGHSNLQPVSSPPPPLHVIVDAQDAGK